MNTPERDTTSDTPQGGHQSGVSTPARVRASRDAKQAIIKEAGQVAVLAKANLSPGSPEVKKQARRLLKAVVAWRESAVKATLDAGLEPRGKPSFRKDPKPPTREARPGAKKYHSLLFFWASRYAWDKHNGLDAKQAARNLVLTAYVGYRKPVAKKNEAEC